MSGRVEASDEVALAIRRRLLINGARESLSEARFRRRHQHCYAGLKGFHHVLLNGAIWRTRHAASIRISPRQADLFARASELMADCDDE